MYDYMYNYIHLLFLKMNFFLPCINYYGPGDMNPSYIYRFHREYEIFLLELSRSFLNYHENPYLYVYLILLHIQYFSFYNSIHFFCSIHKKYYLRTRRCSPQLIIPLNITLDIFRI